MTQLGKEPAEIIVALPLYPPLIGTLAVRSIPLAPFAVAPVQRVDPLHAGHHLRKGGELLLVKEAVVSEVEEDLRGARIRSGVGEGDRSPLVGHDHGVILDHRRPLAMVNDGHCGDAGLGHEVLEDAEEAGIVIEMMVDEGQEAIGS